MPMRDLDFTFSSITSFCFIKFLPLLLYLKTSLMVAFKTRTLIKLGCCTHLTGKLSDFFVSHWRSLFILEGVIFSLGQRVQSVRMTLVSSTTGFISFALFFSNASDTLRFPDTAEREKEISGDNHRVIVAALILSFKLNKNKRESVLFVKHVISVEWVPSKRLKYLFVFLYNLAVILCRNKRLKEIGLSYFPLDYPDCNAYSYFMAMDSTATDQKARGRPPSQRPLEIPIPPPWDCVKHSFVELCGGQSLVLFKNLQKYILNITRLL